MDRLLFISHRSMNTLDIRQIALYLSGKLPPYYGDSNLRSFTKQLRIFAPQEFTNDEMLFIQQQARNIDEDIYFTVLDDLWQEAKDTLEPNKKSKQDIIQLIQNLWVPKELIGLQNIIIEEYTWDTYKQLLTQRYWTNPSNNDKWELFEELCRDILSKDWFINIKVASRWADGGVDITADKEILIWKNTKKFISFFWQCKYKTTGNVSKDEVNALITPIINDTNNMYQWILFLTNQKYNSNAKEILDNTQSSRANIKSFYLNGDELLDIINNYQDLQEKYNI